MVKVSIIMPVYNANEFIKEAIGSAINQSLNDIEILCVNDGSTDNSMETLKKLSNKYKCIKLFSQENAGSGKARNYALDESKGEYIAFLDADDVFVEQHALETLYNIGIENNAEMVCGNLKRLSDKGVISDNPNCKSKNYYCFDKHCTISPEEYGVPWAFYKNIFKKSFLDDNEIRFKDLRRGQDPVFLAEILTKIDTVYGAPVDLYAYRFNSKIVYDKIDTYIKKLHHVTHFKECFDILEKGNLHTTSEKFKPHLMHYFDKSIQTKDISVYDCALNVFGKTPKYFNGKLKKKYDLFLTYHIMHKLHFENSEEFFKETKKDLINMEILKNDLLSNFLLINVVLVLTSNNYKDYKIKYSKLKMSYLKNKNKQLKSKNKSLKDSITNLEIFNDVLNENNSLKNKNKNLQNNIKLNDVNKKLKDENKKLKIKNEHLKEDILKIKKLNNTSNSKCWKLTKLLR